MMESCGLKEDTFLPVERLDKKTVNPHSMFLAMGGLKDTPLFVVVVVVVVVVVP